MKVVIVGGVAGGATAAARIRRLDEDAQVIVLERSGYVSYANCGLPYYVGGVICDKEELTLQTPEKFRKRFCVEVRTRHEVTAIDPLGKKVTVCGLDTGEVYEESYDKLLLSPGAKPVKPDFPGMDSDRLFTLRTVEDTLHIREFMERQAPKTAVLVGGGYIGLEMAENLMEMGVQVTIVQRPVQLMNTLDYDMAAFIHAKMREQGAVLKFGSNVTGFGAQDGFVEVYLQNEEPLRADMAVLAIGVSPDTAIAAQAGIRLGIKGSIVVNDRMETSVPDIYAVGDAVQVRHSVSGRDALISLDDHSAGDFK